MTGGENTLLGACQAVVALVGGLFTAFTLAVGLYEKAARESKRRRALEDEKTGLEIQKLRAELGALGITPETIGALPVVPTAAVPVLELGQEPRHLSTQDAGLARKTKAVVALVACRAMLCVFAVFGATILAVAIATACYHSASIRVADSLGALGYLLATGGGIVAMSWLGRKATIACHAVGLRRSVVLTNTLTPILLLIPGSLLVWVAFALTKDPPNFGD